MSGIAIAADTSNQIEKIYFQYYGNGQYGKTIETRTVNIDSRIIEAIATESEDIYLVDGNEYLVQVSQDIYTLAEKIEIDETDFNANTSIFEMYSIPEKLRDDIEENIEREALNDNEDFSISLYVPANISLLSSSATDFTYQGHKLRNYIVDYNNCSVGPVNKNGSNAKNAAASLTNFVLSCVGCVSKTVTIFGLGVSAYDVYASIHGEVQYGSQGDKTYSLLVYDKKTKDTHYYDPYVQTWQEGCFSQYVKMKRNDTYQFYGATGKSELTKKTLSTTYWTEHYYDPLFAVQAAPVGFVDNYIFVNLYGTSCRL